MFRFTTIAGKLGPPKLGRGVQHPAWWETNAGQLTTALGSSLRKYEDFWSKHITENEAKT